AEADRQISSLLPRGVQTPDHLLWRVMAEEDGSSIPVGILYPTPSFSERLVIGKEVSQRQDAIRSLLPSPRGSDWSCRSIGQCLPWWSEAPDRDSSPTPLPADACLDTGLFAR